MSQRHIWPGVLFISGFPLALLFATIRPEWVQRLGKLFNASEIAHNIEINHRLFILVPKAILSAAKPLVLYRHKIGGTYSAKPMFGIVLLAICALLLFGYSEPAHRFFNHGKLNDSYESLLTPFLGYIMSTRHFTVLHQPSYYNEPLISSGQEKGHD